MNLSDAIKNEQPHPVNGARCGIQRIREQLGEEGALLDVLLEECSKGMRTATSVSKLLEQVGHPYSGNNIRRHVRGECKCPR